MPIRVQLPNGSFAEFPDGMATADIEAVLARQFGAPEPPDFGNAQGGVASTEETPGYFERLGNTVSEGFKRGSASTLATGLHAGADFIDQTIQAPLRNLGGIVGQSLGISVDHEVAREMGDPLGARSLAAESLGVEREINADRQQVQQQIGGRPSLAQFSESPLNSAKQYSLHLANAGAESLPAFAGAMAMRNPQLAAGVLGGVTGAQTYTDMRADGVGRLDAARAGVANAAIEAAGESFGLPFVMGKAGRGSLMRSMLAEGVQEVPVSLAQGYVEDSTTGRVTPIAEQLGNALDAGLVGAGMGAGGHGLSVGIDALSRDRTPTVTPPPAAPAGPRDPWDTPPSNDLSPATIAAGNAALQTPPVTPSEAVAGPLKPAVQRGEAMADAILGKAKSRRLMADPILDTAALERAGISPIVPPVERPDVFTPELYAALGIQPEPTRDLERLLPESAVPSAPPPVQLDSRPAPVAAPQNLPAPLDTQAASTAQPAEPAAQPFLPERTSGQANPLEAGRLDVAVRPEPTAAPAPVSRDVVGAQAQALTPALAPMSVRVGGDAQAPQQAPTMQNRDRSRAASVSQMQDIRRNPDPERLGFSRDPNTGAPMVGAGKAIPDADKGRTDTVIMASGRRVPVQYAVVEADELAASHDADGRANPAYDAAPLKALNNGRTAGLQAAYASGNTDAYRQGIAADAALHGVPAEAIAGKRKPVLVRLYDPEQNSGDMGAESNATQQLGLSPVEQAQTDARALPDLSGMVWNEDGSISPSGNASFFRGWFANMGETQAASLQDAQGRPNAMALQRVRGAMVHRAYGDERLLTAMAEEIDPDNRNVMNALVQAAPGFAKLDDTPHASDVKAALVGGLTLLRDAKARGIKLADALAQQDMFGRNADADAVAAFMAANARSANRMAEAFKAVAEYAARAESQAATLDVFGSAPEPSVTDALGDAGITERRYGTETGRDGGAVAEGRGGGQQAQEQGAAAGDAFRLDAGAQAQPAAQEVAPPPSAGLFGAPSARDYIDAAQRNKDAARDGKTGTGRTDMLAGDGELFAGDRPAQAEIPAPSQQQADQPKVAAPSADRGEGKADPKFSMPDDEPRVTAFRGMKREQFLGNPKITSDKNAANLEPTELRDLDQAPMVAFMRVPTKRGLMELTARYDADGAAVYDGDRVVASYNFGDTLVVDKAYRRNGIATELVYQWRTRNPGAKPAKFRTRASQSVQEDVWNRIQLELNRLEDSRYSIPASEREANLRRWFGDSKVVDADGNPLVLYHGTAKRFSKISMRKGAQGLFWMTSDREAIERGEVGAAGNGVIMPLYAKITKPAGWDEYDRYGIGELKRDGYDGLILPDGDGSFNVVAFYPDQIKSADRNNGNFDAGDLSILRSQPADTAGSLASPEALLAELKSSPIGRSLVALEKAGVLDIIHDPKQPWAGKWDGRKATLNAAQIPAGKGIGVALHELGVHAERDSLSGILGDAGFTALLATIDRWANSSDPATRDLAANVQRRVNNANTPAKHRDEERLAYAVELAANAGMESGGEIRAFLRRFVAYVKAWLSASKLGSALRARGLNFDLTTQDVAQLAAYAVARQARAAAPSRTGRMAEAFSEPKVAQTDTTAFRKWFGDSVVTEDGKAGGKPLVVYHGTRGNFDVFKSSDAGDLGSHFGSATQANGRLVESRGKTHGLGAVGIMPTPEDGRGENMMPVFLSIKNPLRMVDTGFFGSGDEDFRAVMRENGIFIAQGWSHRETIKAIEARGYDGIVYENTAPEEGGGESWIAFHPNQIKSATGNSGAFDPSNPSILASMPDAGVEFTNGQETLASRLAQWAAPFVQDGGANPRPVEAVPETVGAVTRNAGGAAEQGNASREEIREQSARLIERAKAEGFYWPDDSPILAELGKLPTLAGAEHQVFVVGEGNNRLVIRATDNGFFGHRSEISPAQYLARLDDYSRTFPGLQTRLIGVSESTDVEGHAVIWTVQPFVQGDKFKTQALLSEAMARHGWDEDGYPGVPRFKHESGAIIEDAHTDNVFQDDNGDLYPFDVVVEALPNVRYSMPDSEPGFTLTGIPEKRKSRLVEAFKRARQRRNEVNAALGNPATGGTLGYNADKSEWVGTRGAMRQARESLQDRMILLRDVQQDIEAARGEVLPDEQNVYRMENLMYGRVGKSMETLDDVLFDPLFKAMRKAKVTPETLEEYLYARHAKERNADLRENNPDITAGSGMADDEADAILGRATPALESLAKMVDRITQDTRKRLYSHGIITRAQYEAMQAQFKYYVPLRGKAESEALAESSRAGGLGGGGVEVRGSGIKAMTGRGTRAVNILGEVIGDAQRSVIAAEKARVGRALARLVLANPNPALWTLEPVRTERVKDPKTGEIHERVLNESNSPDVVHVRINGQQYRIQFANVKLAEALKNVGADNLHRYLRPLQGLNRYVSATLTSYNPGFIPVNLTRDAVFGSTRILTEHGAAMYGKVMAAYPKAFAALHKAAIGRPETGRLEEFTSAGAKTGWVTQAAVDTLQKQVRLDAKTGKVADVVRAAKALAHVVEEANSVVENAMRLAYFSALRDAGWTVDAAAEKAKDLTVNFNRQGNLGPWLKVMYLFYNPGVQGAHQVIKALKHPKMKGAMLALGLAQFALAMMAAGMEDDEGEPLSNKVPDFVKERNLWMVWPGKDGEPDRIVTLPMPYGFNVFSFMGGRMAQLVTTDVQAIASNTKRTQQVAADVVGGIGKAILQAFSPVPIDEGMTGLVPTIPLKAVVELGMNKDGLGRRIRNENPFDRTTPLAMQGKADTHEAFKAVARGLNWIGMGDEYHKPLAPLDWAPEDIEYMYGLATGGTGRSLLDVIMLGHDIATGQDRTEKPTPIIKSFTRPINDVSAAQAAFYERKETIETDADRVRDMAEAGGMAAGIAAASAYPHLRGVEIRINKSGEASIWPGDSRVYGAFKAAEKQNDATRRQVKALYGEFGTGLSAGRTKEMRALQQSNADYQRDFIREWNAAADAFSEGR